MIFQNVTELKSHADKAIFREKIGVYVRVVAAVCRKKLILQSVACEEKCIGKMKEIGVIREDSEVAILRKILSKTAYGDFVAALSTEADHADAVSPYLLNLNNQRRREMQQEERRRQAFTLVDLFCGAGGLSLGFKQAGFKTVFANDADRLCIETYRYNHPEIAAGRIVCGDIRELAGEIGDYITEEADIVVGGPPCQGFSYANKHHRVIDDPRNELYKYFLIAVEKLAPKIVVMENVKGMLKVADQVAEDYERIRIEKEGVQYRYSVGYALLLSADFSVAQSRERLVYIAVRNDVAMNRHVTPEKIFQLIQANNNGRPRYNLSSALEGLRSLNAPHKMGVGEVDTEEGGRKIDANPYTGQENAYLRLINSAREIPLVFNHKARYCSELNQEIYCRMHPGDDATDAKIADIMPYAHRNDKFKDKYFRLYADRPCRTITAHLRSDCHSHIHPMEDRALTPREAARVQSFPDDYLFLGPYLKTYIQIGNAVPAVMARGIAETLRAVLEGEPDED